MLNWIASILLPLTLTVTGGGAVSRAVQDAEAAGYAPCHPQVVDAAEGWTRLGFGTMPDNVGGWAVWPEAFNGACEVGLTPWSLENGMENLDYVARHEVCHLSVGVQIDANAQYRTLDDRHHEAPDFKDCMAQLMSMSDYYQPPVPVQEEEDTNPPCHTDAECANWEYSPEDGWVSLVDNGEGSLPECPDAYNGYCADPNAYVHDTVTGASAHVKDLYVQDPPTDAEHCAMLHEVKPWIPCE